MSERSDNQQPTSNKQQATTSNNQQQPTTHKATTNNQQPTTNKATPKSVCWSGGQACLRPNSQTTRWSVNQLPTTTASQIFNATPGHPGKREGRGPLYAASTPQRTAQRQAARKMRTQGRVVSTQGRVVSKPGRVMSKQGRVVSKQGRVGRSEL